jgi:hypothetical protein
VIIAEFIIRVYTVVCVAAVLFGAAPHRLDFLVFLSQSFKLLARLTHSKIALQQEGGDLHLKGAHLAA